LIAVDSSAWIELLRRTESRVDRHLTALVKRRAELAVTEVVALELLAGTRNSAEHDEIEDMLLALELLPLRGLAGYELAAELFRDCRSAGETPSSLLDCLIAAAVIAADVPLLTADRDFDAIARHTALQLVSVDE
jgi:hypothetical protein